MNPEPKGIPPQRPMSPQERTIWLACKGAPKDMIMVTEGEMKRITDALNAEHRTRVGHEAGLQTLMVIFDDYWKTEPDLLNAAAAAVFDARKFQSASKVFGALRSAQKKLDGVLKNPIISGNPALAVDLLSVSVEIGEKIAVLEDQASLRRDRRAIAAKENKG